MLLMIGLFGGYCSWRLLGSTYWWLGKVVRNEHVQSTTSESAWILKEISLFSCNRPFIQLPIILWHHLNVALLPEELIIRWQATLCAASVSPSYCATQFIAELFNFDVYFCLTVYGFNDGRQAGACEQRMVGVGCPQTSSQYRRLPFCGKTGMWKRHPHFTLLSLFFHSLHLCVHGYTYGNTVYAIDAKCWLYKYLILKM